MTKVLNITMHAVNNYGSVLQTLATEKIFHDLDCQIETLDYIQDSLQMDSISKILKHGGPGWKIKFKQIILHLVNNDASNRSKVFEEFRKKYLHLTDHRYYSVQELYNTVPVADIYCTGSDQTWNTTLHGVSEAYFLRFAPVGKKKISFSASFGIEELPDKDKEKAKQYLSEYSAISVRESSGLDILRRLGINNAFHLLDPTLVVDRRFWESISAERQCDKEYIFVYQLNSSRTFTDYVNAFATKKGLPVIYVRSRRNSGLVNGKYFGSPSPEVVLSLFRYSTYVITDSFHATVFSILFHCNFIDILPPFFSTRIKSILDLTKLDSRVVTDLDAFDYTETPINWDEVDELLLKEREKAIEFLKEAINK